MFNKFSIGKLNELYTITEYIETTNIFLVITTYYQDTARTKLSDKPEQIYTFRNKEEAQNFYQGMSKTLFKNLTKTL
jgi:adenine-specific DNA methylase